MKKKQIWVGVVCIFGLLFFVGSYLSKADVTGLNDRNFRYFKRMHFNDWDMDYPQEEEIALYRDKTSFTGDRFDYIIFERSDALVNSIKTYALDHDYIFSMDQSFLLSDGFPMLAYDESVNQALRLRIDNYENYEFIQMKNDNQNTIGIYMSEDEVLFPKSQFLATYYL